MRHIRVSLVAAVLLAAACSSDAPDPSSDATWVGTITTEGDVTTVVNESGSVWGGAATLVEEVSIGVEAGDEPYMLGVVEGIAARGDRIYVLDRQVPALRVYDLDGRHVADFGGKGGGPGEFDVPFGLAVAPDGRIFVRDTRQGRINVYDESGDPVATFPIASTYFTNRPMVATVDGTVWTVAVVDGAPFSPERRTGLQGFRPDGSPTEVVPEPDFGLERQRVVVRRGGGSGTFPVPFSPFSVWALAPSGAMVGGAGDAYRFEVRYPGGELLVVRREVTLVAVDPDEADYYRRSFRERIDRAARDGGTIEGTDPDAIPAVKPAFGGFFAGHEGTVWALRDGPSEYLPDCGGEPGDDPCWRRTMIIDAFGADGRFLGELDIPDGMQFYPQPYIRGDMIIAAFEDEAGTPMVKRYRLVPPGPPTDR